MVQFKISDLGRFPGLPDGCCWHLARPLRVGVARGDEALYACVSKHFTFGSVPSGSAADRILSFTLYRDALAAVDDG